jgi:hypothetical protein
MMEVDNTTQIIGHLKINLPSGLETPTFSDTPKSIFDVQATVLSRTASSVASQATLDDPSPKYHTKPPSPRASPHNKTLLLFLFSISALGLMFFVSPAFLTVSNSASDIIAQDQSNLPTFGRKIITTATPKMIQSLEEKGQHNMKTLEKQQHDTVAATAAATALPVHLSSDLYGRVWLYSLISVDFGGELMLPHWIAHYLSLGVDPDHIILLLNTNSAKTLPNSNGLQTVLSHVHHFNITHHYVWDGQYSSEAHLKRKLEILGQVVTNYNDDWIILADSDEFHDYGPDITVYDFLFAAERQGASYIRGYLVDRVARDGSLPAITPRPAIYEQFPLACAVVGTLYGGKTKKIAAFKAYLRSNQGNHKIVAPEDAEQYFAGSEVGKLSSRGGYFGSEALYHLTPYHDMSDRYVYSPIISSSSSNDGSNSGTHTLIDNNNKWDDIPFAISIAVYHYKWHQGVLNNLKDRAEFYKGNADSGGLPRYQHYTEAETALNVLSKEKKLDINAFRCRDLLASSSSSLEFD